MIYIKCPRKAGEVPSRLKHLEFDAREIGPYTVGSQVKSTEKPVF
ncbi:hypothetical protein [Pseudomonas sp. FEN]|nr:hypothetical protein [Pseudomonas sp. FEN]